MKSKLLSYQKEKYSSPTLDIVLISELDVLTTSLEVGDEWPWD